LLGVVLTSLWLHAVPKVRVVLENFRIIAGALGGSVTSVTEVDRVLSV
jgi:hypothetical protein